MLAECLRKILISFIHIMLIQPLNNKSVRRQQPEHPSILDGLERTNPSIELLLRQLCLKVSNTSIPYCRFRLQ